MCLDGLAELWTCYGTQQEGEVLHVYLHSEPHSSGRFDMQFVYEDMPQESGLYQCRAAVRARMPASGLIGIRMVIIGIQLQMWMRVILDVDG